MSGNAVHTYGGGVLCPDGGKCHHGCNLRCYRVLACEPLSGVYPGDAWPDDVIDAELGLLTGGVLTTDRVGLDSVFLNQFPYLAAAVAPQ